jgi:dienelactone hydrolase
MGLSIVRAPEPASRTLEPAVARSASACVCAAVLASRLKGIGEAKVPESHRLTRNGRRFPTDMVLAVPVANWSARLAEVVLFHHALGLTPGVIAFADEVRRAGHIVHTPDLYDGHTFTTLEEGIAHAGEIGLVEVAERGLRAAEMLPAQLVHAGFSLGVVPAQRLAQTRAGARGALLVHSCLPVSEFGPAWPGRVPVQVHAMEADPFFVDDGDIDAARGLVGASIDAELFLYPGDQHLFADSSLPSCAADAAALLTQRVLAFLGSAG